MAGRGGKVNNLSSLLDVLQNKIDEDGIVDPSTFISLGDVMDLIGHRAYGPLLLIVGLTSISPLNIIPGVTWALAALALLVSVQMALHRDHPWMPQKALSMKLSEEKLSKFIRGARPTARFVDKFIQPRLTFLAEPPWIIGVAVLCALAALITFPLGLLPFVPLVPAFAIVFFGLGLTAKDGLMLSLGVIIMGGAIWLLASRFI